MIICKSVSHRYAVPDFGVHFVAVNDGVDSTRGENEFTAIRNVFNEKCMPAILKEDTRYLAIKGKPANTLLQSRLMAI